MKRISQNLIWAVAAVTGVVLLIAALMIGMGTLTVISFITPSWLLLIIFAFMLSRRIKKWRAK